MSERSSGWSRKFEDPIALTDGRRLVTLHDAATYITALPDEESHLPEWQTAIEALMLVSRGGPTMMARIGVMKALNRHVERVFNPERKDRGSGYSRETSDRSVSQWTAGDKNKTTIANFQTGALTIIVYLGGPTWFVLAI
jgi:hypothetical protein